MKKLEYQKYLELYAEVMSIKHSDKKGSNWSYDLKEAEDKLNGYLDQCKSK